MYYRSTGLSFSAALRDIQASAPRARVAAAEVLGEAKTDEERDQALSSLSQASADRRPEVRTTACFALANLETSDAAELIALCLDDPDPEVRQSAAIALGSLGSLASEDGFKPLLKALQEGPVDLRFQAATSLAELDADRAYLPLVAALADGDGEVLGAVALSLGAIGNAACADQIVSLLDHSRRQTRLDAAYALAQFGDCRSLETLSAGLASQDEGWDAVGALHDLGETSTSALANFVSGQTGEERVRVRAAGVLLELQEGKDASVEARSCLLRALSSRRLELRGLAVQQLAEVGGGWARAPLQALQSSFRGRQLRDEIDEALGKIESRS